MRINSFDVRTRVHAAWLRRWERMSSHTRDEGMETLEKLILGAVVLAVAVAFGTIFNSTASTLMDRFQAAVGL
ncbi:hypothetical protein [Streptomyces sp. NBC_01500]|uniref:hypothetical protein n=1 Tax=Streptomyces sp. NBC_01500 TaxID=2903886 RepID=UPI0022515DD2|nr:hypothetical protein [Streptomyces sp. NBC_01500]MCX4554238.1 hypothetical protein [Streptomyces sp. NBC_01500]